MGKLLLLFTLVPLVELYLLLLLARLIDFWPTVGIVLVTGIVGAWLAKREGLRVVRKWQQSLAEGRVPEEGVLGGVLVLVGGVLLVTPGVLTDVVGLLLLVPASRRLIAAQVRKRVERGMERGTVRVVSYTSREGMGGMGTPPGWPRARRDGYIDVEGEVVDDEASRPHQLSGGER